MFLLIVRPSVLSQLPALQVEPPKARHPQPQPHGIPQLPGWPPAPCKFFNQLAGHVLWWPCVGMPPNPHGLLSTLIKEISLLVVSPIKEQKLHPQTFWKQVRSFTWFCAPGPGDDATLEASENKAATSTAGSARMSSREH